MLFRSVGRDTVVKATGLRESAMLTADEKKALLDLLMSLTGSETP